MDYFHIAMHSVTAYLLLKSPHKQLSTYSSHACFITGNPSSTLLQCATCYWWLTHFSLSALYVCAISGTSGSSGFGSHNSEQMERRTARQEQSYVSTFINSYKCLYLIHCIRLEQIQVFLVWVLGFKDGPSSNS